MKQTIQEAEQVWVKRVIPLFPPSPSRGLLGLRTARNKPEGVVVFIQDTTEEVRKEQELKIKSAMIQEVHHRVKNNLQTIAALLRMESSRTRSRAAKNSLKQSVARVLSMAVVHEFLSRGDTSDIQMRDVCNRIAGEVSTGMIDPQKRVRINVEGESFSLPAQQATSCALALNELLANAVEHSEGPAAKMLKKASSEEITAALEELAKEHGQAGRSYRLACVAGTAFADSVVSPRRLGGWGSGD